MRYLWAMGPMKRIYHVREADDKAALVEAWSRLCDENDGESSEGILARLKGRTGDASSLIS